MLCISSIEMPLVIVSLELLCSLAVSASSTDELITLNRLKAFAQRLASSHAVLALVELLLYILCQWINRHEDYKWLLLIRLRYLSFRCLESVRDTRYGLEAKRTDLVDASKLID